MKNLKPAIPHLIAILIFWIIGAIFFAPQYDGYDLNQGDVTNQIGMGKEITDYVQKNKTYPLWTNSMFGGMPAYQIAGNNYNVLNSIELFFVNKIFKSPLGFLMIAMISFYILLLCFEIDPWLSIVGAIAFGFSSINILYIGSGHVPKIHAITLLPGIIGSMIYAYRKNYRIGAVMLSVFVCLHLSANHIQQTYYFIFLALAIIIVEFYSFYKQHKTGAFFKISAFLLLGTVIGVLPTVSNLIMTNEYSKYTTRSKSELTILSNQAKGGSITNEGLNPDYIKEYNLGAGEMWSMVIPNAKGGASGRLGEYKEKLKDVNPDYRNFVANNFSSYWGEQSFTGGAFYFGACMFLLFILGLVFVKDYLKWALLAASVLAILLSLKYSFILDFFIENVPLFNKFRDTKMILYFVQIAFPLVGLMFVKEMFTHPLNKKKLNYALAITLGIFILFYVMPDTWFNFITPDETGFFDNQKAHYGNNSNAIQQLDQLKDEVQNVRISIFKDDVLRSIFFIILTGSLILLYTKNKIAKKYFIMALGFLVFIDMWMVDKRYLNNSKEGHHWIKSYERSNPFRAGFADMQIMNREISNNEKLKNDIMTGLAGQDNSKIPQKFIAVEKEKLSFSILNSETDYRVFTFQNPFANANVSYYHKSIGGYHGAKLRIYQELIDFRLSKEDQILSGTLKSNPFMLDYVLKNNTRL